MGNGSVAGAIVMAICCFSCAIGFFCIGFWAEKSEIPVHFWAGTVVDPDKVEDISGYNHANAVMWRVYSIPYWLAGLLGCLGFLGDIYTLLAAALLFLACFPGISLLVRRYRKIEEQYIN